jgi:hypothetical protein
VIGAACGHVHGRHAGVAQLQLHLTSSTPTCWSSPMQEQEQKLRGEYLGLGGSANSPIPNYFLYIILGISFLAVSV